MLKRKPILLANLSYPSLPLLLQKGESQSKWTMIHNAKETTGYIRHKTTEQDTQHQKDNLLYSNWKLLVTIEHDVKIYGR